MKLRALGREPILIAGVRPNAGVRAMYQRELLRLVNAMCAAVDNTLLPIYKTRMGLDATLQATLRRLSKRWQGSFDNMAGTISEAFANNVLRHSDLAFQAALSKGGFTVPFRPTKPILQKVRGITRDNVDLIKSIPSEFFGAIHADVFESVKSGRDLAGLTEKLHERYAITRRRAAFISRDQNNKATAQIHKLRQLDLGIEEGIWHHTAASLQPREEHAEFDGERYSIAEGHDFENGSGPVQPGEDYNCGCFGSSVIPGYDD